MTAAEWYRRFADTEAAGQSALYETLARGVADDPALLTLLDELPRPKQQPNLLLACARLLGAPLSDFAAWRVWLLQHWPEVSAEMRIRATQTNEPRRCATLLPALALIDGPIALIEVGASAGLTLLPEHYSYAWGEHRLDPAAGPSTVLLECEVTGDPPLPARMPEIVWRAGLDLNPLDVTAPDDRHWLETLIWPEQTARLERVRAAIAIAERERPRVVRGDAVDDLPALAAEAPTGVTLVIVTSAAIVYLMPEPRARLIEWLRASPARWVSNEGAGIVPRVQEALAGHPPRRPGGFALALDERPLAYAGAHGQTLDWLSLPAA